jgi:hypothetical protein
MRRFFVVSAESLQPRDGALTGELLAQVHSLLTHLETGEGLTPQEQVDLAHLKALCTEVGMTPPSPLPAVPWVQKVKRVLFAAEAAAEEGMVRCTYCGSTDVRPKERKPRLTVCANIGETTLLKNLGYNRMSRGG